MKTIKRFLRELFDPENDLDVSAIGAALNDSGIRARWLTSVLDEIRQMNQDVDKALISGREYSLTHLCARRQAYKDILEAVLSARRTHAQEPRHNPNVQGVNLDRVTA